MCFGLWSDDDDDDDDDVCVRARSELITAMKQCTLSAERTVSVCAPRYFENSLLPARLAAREETARKSAL